MFYIQNKVLIMLAFQFSHIHMSAHVGVSGCIYQILNSVDSQNKPLECIVSVKIHQKVLVYEKTCAGKRINCNKTHLVEE